MAGFAYVANSRSQSISAFTIDASTGRLSEVAGSPFTVDAAPLVVTADPSGRFAYVVGRLISSGLDAIMAYTINPTTGALTSAGAPVMTEFLPFSLTIDPSGKFAYAAGGGNHPWVSAYAIDATTGALSEVAGSPFMPQEWGPQSVTVDGFGKFVYVTNPGWMGAVEDSISAFAINATTGALSEIAGSPFPAQPARSDPYYVIGPVSIISEPSGRFAYTANYNSRSVFAYAIDATTGALTGISDVGAQGYLPHAVTVDPSGKFVYTANQGSNDVSGFAIDANTGALTSIGTIAAGSNPVSITTTRPSQ